MSYLGYRSEFRSLICTSSDRPSSCKLLYSIPQAFFLGRVHFSVLSLVFFSTMSVLATAKLLLDPSGWHHVMYIVENAWKTLWILALPFIPYLVYLELAVARAICVWCTIMHVIVVLMSAYVLSSIF